VSIDRAIDILATKQSILVFTGAGISTESGIPDFRGPDGVWTKVDPEDFTIDRYLAHREVRERSWAMRAESGAIDAAPNEGHHAVVSLWEAGVVAGVVTQNIDGLHTAAGLPESVVTELHGNARTTRCVSCGQTSPTSGVLKRISAGDVDPRCVSCDGLLKVDVVFFGEAMPADAMTKALALAAECDAVLCVGSTLSVFPAAYVPITATETGAPLVIINQGPTDLDRLAAVRLDHPAGSTLRTIASALQ
jgi:NAD-dependent deacetylase